MKRRLLHLLQAGAALVGGTGMYREIFEPIRGTGQRVSDLLAAHWTFWEIHRYLTEPALNLVSFLLAGGVVVLVQYLKKKEEV